GSPAAPDGLPLIDLPELGAGGMGFEGYLYYDASEIENGNPWREDMAFETMPVFKNGAYDASNLGVPLGLDGDEVMRRLERAAAALGVEILETRTELDDYTDEDKERYCEFINGHYRANKGLPPISVESFYRQDGAVISITARTEIGTLRACANGEVVVDLWSNYPFNQEYGLEPIELPECYSFTHFDTTREQALETMEYLTREYAQLLDFDEPAFVVSGDYNIYGQYHRKYDAYDASGDDLQDILNYSFRCASFSPDDGGHLSGIRLYDNLAVLEKIGDYPVIGMDEARERLIAGLYQTSAPCEMPGEEYVVKAELMYRSSIYEEVLLPYYRFYVELPEAQSAGSELGLKTFGAYYVPAIESRYIGSAETYHGQFN
ncbi:MAG: hypothetical protein NC319_03025, partial [Butyricicoccus sp.]|nr:hypothetical protein [Butyricicoccus sp.]